MPNPSPLGFARPRTPLQRRLGVVLLLLSALLATFWALDGDRSPPAPAEPSDAPPAAGAAWAPDGGHEPLLELRAEP